VIILNNLQNVAFDKKETKHSTLSKAFFIAGILSKNGITHNDLKKSIIFDDTDSLWLIISDRLQKFPPNSKLNKADSVFVKYGNGIMRSDNYTSKLLADKGVTSDDFIHSICYNPGNINHIAISKILAEYPPSSDFYKKNCVDVKGHCVSWGKN
jgi:hypothetical protein